MPAALPAPFATWVQVDSNPQVGQIARVGATTAYTNANNAAIMSWGPIIFQVWPLNYNEMDHETETAWAHKEIAGAAIYREWVGEGDESRVLRGIVFPYRIGGNTMLEQFDAYRRNGVANLLLSGGPVSMNLGWFVCEKLSRNHSAIAAEGIGQVINFEATMRRVPVPTQADYVTSLFLS